MANPASSLSLQFFGASGTVTGSKYLLNSNGSQYLIDCGLFQGLKKLRLQNRAIPPFDPRKIKAILLTHAHLDHVGYLPVLVKHGFTGPVYCTAPTAHLAGIILRDSAKLQEEEAALANEKGFSEHKPALPLYDTKDVERTLPLLHIIKTDNWVELEDDFRFRMQPNGHVLGATFIEIETQNRRIVFSGDIGRRYDHLLPDPERPTRADVLVMESTYGDRLHPQVDEMQQLAHIIHQTYERGGTVIIPSFALQRAQMLMLLLWELKRRKMLPKVQLYMDSPMGVAVMKVFEEFTGWHKLSARECEQMLRSVTMLENYKASQYVVNDERPKVVIASSGMVTGGRVLSYLEKYIQAENNTTVLAGYQAEGTRGRQLQDGAAEIKIRGEYYPVRARVIKMDSMSSHADQHELLDWVALLRKAPKHVFLTHGEPQAADALRVKLHHQLGWNPVIPELGEEFDLA